MAGDALSNSDLIVLRSGLRNHLAGGNCSELRRRLDGSSISRLPVASRLLDWVKVRVLLRLEVSGSRPRLIRIFIRLPFHLLLLAFAWWIGSLAPHPLTSINEVLLEGRDASLSILNIAQ